MKKLKQKWRREPRSETHWAGYAARNHPSDNIVSQLSSQFLLEGVTKGKAVDLGCGKGMRALELISLRMGCHRCRFQ